MCWSAGEKHAAKASWERKQRLQMLPCVHSSREELRKPFFELRMKKLHDFSAYVTGLLVKTPTRARIFYCKYWVKAG